MSQYFCSFNTITVGVDSFESGNRSNGTSGLFLIKFRERRENSIRGKFVLSRRANSNNQSQF
jgi:hypothetical protein